MTAQRLALDSTPGSLLKSFPRPRSRAVILRDNDYLAMVRQLPCLKCGLDPCGVAAHVRYNEGRARQAAARKPADCDTVPLCEGCHTADPDSQHRMGELLFWNGLGINPLLVAERLYAKRGDIPAMRAIAFNAIAEREVVSQNAGIAKAARLP